MSPGPVNWSQDQAETIVKSLTRYTKFVRSTKMGLGIFSLLLIAVILFYPLLHKKDPGLRISFSSSKPEPAPTTMTSPKFIGLDKNNQPYNFSASVASEINKDEVNLEKPAGDMQMKNSQRISVNAQNGVFNRKDKKLALKGNVTMSDQQGYVMRTERLMVDVGNKSAVTAHEVHGNGPMGTLKAYGGAMADGTNQQLIFEGPVFVTLNMNSKDKETGEKRK